MSSLTTPPSLGAAMGINIDTDPALMSDIFLFTTAALIVLAIILFIIFCMVHIDGWLAEPTDENGLDRWSEISWEEVARGRERESVAGYEWGVGNPYEERSDGNEQAAGNVREESVEGWEGREQREWEEIERGTFGAGDGRRRMDRETRRKVLVSIFDDGIQRGSATRKQKQGWSNLV